MKIKASIVYLISYILPIPIYVFSFLMIIMFGCEQRYSNIGIYLLLIMGMTLIITLFNYISYKKAFKYLDEQVNKKIFRRLILFNIILNIIVIIAIEN